MCRLDQRGDGAEMRARHRSTGFNVEVAGGCGGEVDGEGAGGEDANAGADDVWLKDVVVGEGGAAEGERRHRRVICATQRS